MLTPQPPICHRCGKLLTPGRAELYIARIEAFADPDVGVLPSDDRQDLDAEYDRLIEQMSHMSERELMDQVHRRVTITLCAPCYRAWIENPAGSPEP